MISIIFTADNHLTATRPRYRTDSWVPTTLRKFEFILSTARQTKSIVVCAGDLFDKAIGPLWYINRLMELMEQYSDVEVYSVLGNHDEHFHNPDIMRTQFGTLVKAGFIKLLKDPVVKFSTVIVGRSWNEPYQEPDTLPQEGKFKILVAHSTVTKDIPPPWLTAVSAKDFIELHPGYDLIVTGDFHEKFVVEHNGCALLNTGPMLRSSIDKINFKPSIWLHNSNGITEIPIPIDNDVFLATAEIEKEVKEADFLRMISMTQLVNSLDMSKHEKPSFEDIVRSGLSAMDADKAELKSEIQEIMDYVSR